MVQFAQYNGTIWTEAGWFDAGGNGDLNGTLNAALLKTDSYTVATLPAAGTAGRRAIVTDASAPSWGATVAGGGAVKSPVFDDGANWKVG